MNKKIEYVPINTMISKRTHKGLKDFIQTHKLRNMTLTYGFILEIALLYLFESIQEDKVSLESLSSRCIEGE